MKELLRRSEKWVRIECWGISLLFATALSVYVINRLDAGSALEDAPNRIRFEAAGMTFNFYQNYLIPVVMEFIIEMIAFMVLNFYLVPKLLIKQRIVLYGLLVILIFLTLGLADAVTDRYIHPYMFEGKTADDQRMLVFQSFLIPVRLFILFSVYTLLKYTGLYFIVNVKSAEQRFRFVQRDGISAFVIWLLSMFMLIAFDVQQEIILAWAIVAPVGILLYTFSFYSLISSHKENKNIFWRYLLKVLLVQLAFLLPVFMLTMLSLHNRQTGITIALFNFFFQLLITAPATWFIYNRYAKSKEEITGLQKELGHTHANLDFLRSQINPHFLFNVLNTLYGTALQEKAARTSEGIERLGDMMRFMLRENVQEKIALVNELKYLNNYISLQRLRTDTIARIRIDITIQEVNNELSIAPMLLIPFVENAFKHGISLRDPSFIKVSVEVRENVIYLEVQNSRHKRTTQDPESNKSRIGLENVKQRLNMLYPDHELIIQETEKDYWIQLRLPLLD